MQRDDLMRGNNLSNKFLQQMALLNSIPDIAWLKDNESRFIAVNEPFGRACGYSPEELVGKTDLDIWPKELADSYRADDRDVMESRQMKRVEEPLEDREGKQKWIETIKVPILGDGGEVIGTVGIARDITIRKEKEKLAEDALVESEERYRSLVDNSPEMIFIVCDGRIVYMNDTGLKLLGASFADEVVGKPIMAFIHPESRELIRQRAQEVVGQRKRTELVAQKYLKLNGDDLEVEAMGLPVLYRNQPATQVYARDITIRKEMEDALFRSREQLRQAQKMEAVGRLAGGVAHDFNNFLTAINGYAELLTTRVVDGGSVPREIAEIRKVGERAAKLTRQLLAFSRKQVLMPKVFDMNEVVAGVSEMLRRFIGENIEFRTSFCKDLWPVKADPGQIEQVIMNLAINARDAMPEGGTLAIETENVMVSEPLPAGTAHVPTGQYVVLGVSDTGCGIDQATMSHLFEPFFTTKVKGKGTGLGLATVYGIVKQSGGFILVDSEPGKGTTFSLYLSRTESKEKAEAAATDRETLSRGKGVMIVVEDQEEIRNLVVEVLGMQGYTVLKAANGDEAMQISRTTDEKIQMLLTDLVMPGMSGKELAERMKRELPGLKVLFMSGYAAGDGSMESILPPGGNFLAKPFTLGDLTQKVKAVLDSTAEK